MALFYNFLYPQNLKYNAKNCVYFGWYSIQLDHIHYEQGVRERGGGCLGEGMNGRCTGGVLLKGQNPLSVTNDDKIRKVICRWSLN